MHLIQNLLIPVLFSFYHYLKNIIIFFFQKEVLFHQLYRRVALLSFWILSFLFVHFVLAIGKKHFYLGDLKNKNTNKISSDALFLCFPGKEV